MGLRLLCLFKTIKAARGRIRGSMDISKISIGENAPEVVNAIIENPLGGVPVKYELDKETGFLRLDWNFAQRTDCVALDNSFCWKIVQGEKWSFRK